MKKICVLPGDGIGPEVTEAALMVLRSATDELDFEHADIGGSAFEKTGSYLPDETMALMRSCDSCLFGAVTTPDTPGYDSAVLRFRKELELFANVRPVRTIISRLGRPSIDAVIVRENTEGLYTQNDVFDDEGVTTLRKVTRKGCERIVDFAIEYARSNGRKRLTCVHKSNVLKGSDGLFLEIFRKAADVKGQGLAFDDQLVDSAAMRLVVSPSMFDVIVTLNLYGDILSDVAAGVAGGLGFAPSGNIGKRHSVFEPAHGSAPDIAGRDIANPTAAVLAGAMMLEHLGMAGPALAIRDSVSSVYASGHLTVDVGGRHGTKSFAEHVASKVAMSLR